MDQKLKVGILGGTGMVGQRFISLLENHPWFEVVAIAASPRSAGKTYEEAVGGRWKMHKAMPEAVKNIVVMNVNEVEKVASEVDFVFSAVDMSKEEIRAIEDAYAKTETPVVSNNSAHRWTPDVPMVVPEINPEHMHVIEYQKKRLGTKRGFVAVKPNCSIQSYAPVLTAWKEFEPYEVVATTYQAISGAGKTFKDWPEMVENIIPFIGGEEEKSEQEPLRLFGKVVDGKIEKAAAPLITTQCIRVPVLDGHTAAVFVNFEKKPTKEQIIEKWPMAKEDCYKLVKYVNDNWTKVWEYWINYTAHDSKEFKPLESAPGDGSLEKLFDSIGDEVFKILFIQDEEVTVAMQKDLKEKFGNKFRFDTSWPNGLEIQRVDSGKGIAVEYLKKHFNQHIHTTIGVGDQENDISLLQNCDIGYAVGNAKENVKKLADRVTVPNTENAIKAIIEDLDKQNY